MTEWVNQWWLSPWGKTYVVEGYGDNCLNLPLFSGKSFFLKLRSYYTHLMLLMHSRFKSVYVVYVVEGYGDNCLNLTSSTFHPSINAVITLIISNQSCPVEYWRIDIFTLVWIVKSKSCLVNL